MKRKVKRKYTRKVLPDAPKSTTEPIKEESSSIVLPEFTFNDLPFSLRMGVESVIRNRKRLKLPDDSKERKVMAVKYFKGDRPR